MKINDLTTEALEQESYFATQDLVDVVNAAIFLDKPLLIEGPAGTGKTSFTTLTKRLLNVSLVIVTTSMTTLWTGFVSWLQDRKSVV